MDKNSDSGLLNFSINEFVELLAILKAKQEYGVDYEVVGHTVSPSPAEDAL